MIIRFFVPPAAVLCIIASQAFGGACDEGPVVNGAALRAALESAADRRIDIVGIGDSNQARAGSGWDEGMHVALLDEFEQYATPLQTQNENGGNGFGDGYLLDVRNALEWVDGTLAIATDAPPFFAEYCPPYAVDMAFENVHAYAYTGGATAFQGTVRNGVRLDAACPVDVTAALRGSICYGQFGTIGDGRFVPQFRGQGDVDLVTASVVNCEGFMEDAMGLFELDVPADPGRAGDWLEFRIMRTSTSYAGRAFTLYVRIENLDREAGFSYHTWGAHSGQSLRYFANLIVNNDEGVTDTYKQYYFQQLRRLQSDDPIVIFWINHGLNDRQETLPSVGELGIEDGSSPEAYADNLQATIDRINLDWIASGGSPTEVHFVIDPSHPISDPPDPLLAGYRAAARQVALSNARTAMVDVSALTSHDEMMLMGDYLPGDVFHLQPSGYTRLSRLKLAALLETPVDACPSDIDDSGAVGLTDLLAVLSTWGKCLPKVCCTADLDGNGSVGFSDLLAIISVWGACP